MLLPGQRADRKEACEVWGHGRGGQRIFHNVMNVSSHVIIDVSLSRWEGEQEDDRPEEGIMPTGDTNDSLCKTVHRTSHVSHTQTLSRVSHAELTLGSVHSVCHFSK